MMMMMMSRGRRMRLTWVVAGGRRRPTRGYQEALGRGHWTPPHDSRDDRGDNRPAAAAAASAAATCLRGQRHRIRRR
eukprot:COSAG01_NODE_70351_length_259_cov_0.250000_1_plen_76_part_10